MAALWVAVSGCKTSGPVYFTGRTMGTVYHITVVPGNHGAVQDLAGKISEKLAAVNASMSLFDKTSELSRFNKTRNNQSFCVSAPFMKVFRTGQDLHRITFGAWDGTVAPLVNLWGFGSRAKTPSLPDDASLEKALAVVGYHRIKVVDEHCLVKDREGLELDFGSIAKGYAVDEVAELLESNRIEHYLVEIGGEVRAGGTKNGKPWKVGINTPQADAPVDQVLTAMELCDRAVATSGDYRNFRTWGGERYSHEIDPRTGRPVRNNVASVSVIADTAMFADGLATALMVMGEEKGLSLVNRLERVDCLFIIRDEKASKGKGFRMAYSSGFTISCSR